MEWDTVKPRKLSTYIERWTELADYCHKTNKDCAHCSVALNYDVSWKGNNVLWEDGGCQMPPAVQYALDENIPRLVDHNWEMNYIPSGYNLWEITEDVEIRI